MSKKLKEGELYEVTWHDAYGTSGWGKQAFWQDTTASVCVTVGYYIGKDKAGNYLFAGTWDKVGDSYSGVAGRPIRMVQKIRKLK